MHEPGDRERLRRTFDTAAARYLRARPSYPNALFDTLIADTGLQPTDRLLEVGCGTGKATEAFARRGFAITAIEPGGNLAAVAREVLGPYPDVTVVTADFEAWTPPSGVGYDLVYAATAWHWVDPAVRYGKAAKVLRPGGHLAVWSATHVFPDGGDPFFAEIQNVYDEIGEGLPPGARRPRPAELSPLDLERDSGGLFRNLSIRHFNWDVVYDAEQYIDLLETFSGHIAMQDWQRDRLYGEIRRRLASRPDGCLRRGWGAVLEVARLR